MGKKMSEEAVTMAAHSGSQTAIPSRVLIEACGLRVEHERYGRVTTLVDGVSFRLSAGSTLAIIGESGAGKSLTCRALLGLLPRNMRTSGSVRFMGKELIGLTERQFRAHRGAG